MATVLWYDPDGGFSTCSAHLAERLVEARVLGPAGAYSFVVQPRQHPASSAYVVPR